jgi:hypothetical protein
MENYISGVAMAIQGFWLIVESMAFPSTCSESLLVAFWRELRERQTVALPPLSTYM